MPSSTVSIHILLELARVIKQGKEIKCIHIEREELKMSLCRWHDWLWREFQRNRNKQTKNPRAKQYKKIIAYKVNI